jgi:acyl carrier protein
MSDHDDLLLPDDLVAVEELLRELDPDDRRLDLPPGDLWDGIVTELGDELAATGAAPRATAPNVADDPAVATETRSADVVDLADRRRRTRFVSVAAAAVAVVVAGIVAVTVGGDDELLESGLLDSMAALRLATFVEDEFRFKMQPSDFVVENFKTVVALAALVRRRAEDGGRAS